MMTLRRSFAAFCLLPFLMCSGCRPPADEPVGTSSGGTVSAPAHTPAATSANGRASSTPAAIPADAGDGGDALLDPFDPPPLDELEAKATWEDQLVLDAMDRYLEHKARHPPLVSVWEALRLKNDSPSANERILSALGQPPESDAEVDWDASVNLHTPIDVKSTNPILGSSVTEFRVADLTGVSLFAFDWDFIPFANSEVVTSWQSSADRMYDKVVLRDDLTWSDSRPITAHDVAFTFQAIMNPKVPAVAVRSGTDKLRWVHAYDDRTVVFFPKDPLATNMWNIFFPVLPRHIYEKSIDDDPSLGSSEHHLKYEDRPVVGGAYQIVRRQRNQEIVLERREDWYMHGGRQVRRKPYIREVRLKIIEDPNTALLAVKKGSIDDLELRAEQWVTQTGGDDFYDVNTKAYGTEWSYGYIGWNLSVPFFSDRRVRQAMAYALNHKEMIQDIGFGLYEPGRGTYHPTSWMFPKNGPQPYQQDLDKAEELLDAAGWTDSDGDGIRDREISGAKTDFEFTILLPSGSETGQRILELLKQNLDQIGVVCHIKPTEFTVLQENARTHKFQAITAGWGTGTDPDTGTNLWTTEAIEQNGRNYGMYSNPEVDRLFEEGRRAFDREKRAEIYGRIHSILWEDQPYMWLYYRSAFYAFNKRLRGYMFSPRNPYGYAPGFAAIWVPKE